MKLREEKKKVLANQINHLRLKYQKNEKRTAEYWNKTISNNRASVKQYSGKLMNSVQARSFASVIILYVFAGLSKDVDEFAEATKQEATKKKWSGE